MNRTDVNDEVKRKKQPEISSTDFRFTIFTAPFQAVLDVFLTVSGRILFDDGRIVFKKLMVKFGNSLRSLIFIYQEAEVVSACTVANHTDIYITD